jgi:hypothetical protein
MRANYLKLTNMEFLLFFCAVTALFAMSANGIISEYNNQKDKF